MSARQPFVPTGSRPPSRAINHMTTFSPDDSNPLHASAPIAPTPTKPFNLSGFLKKSKPDYDTSQVLRESLSDAPAIRQNELSSFSLGRNRSFDTLGPVAVSVPPPPLFTPQEASANIERPLQNLEVLEPNRRPPLFSTSNQGLYAQHETMSKELDSGNVAQHRAKRARADDLRGESRIPEDMTERPLKQLKTTYAEDERHKDRQETVFYSRTPNQHNPTYHLGGSQQQTPPDKRSAPEYVDDQATDKDTLGRILGRNVDDCVENYLEKYEAAVVRWRECTHAEWAAGGEELMLKFSTTLDLVKSQLASKMRLFAKVDAKVDAHKSQLREREDLLKLTNKRLLQQSEEVLKGTMEARRV